MEDSPQNNNTTAETLAVLLMVFNPALTINDDCMTTAEILEIVSEHTGESSSKEVYDAMKEAGFTYTFNYARREMVWLVEYK